MPIDELDASCSAVVIVDLQRSVVAMSVAPHSATTVVANSARLADAFRTAGSPVILVRGLHSSDGGDALRPKIDAAPLERARVEDGHHLVDEVVVGNDIVVTKKQWGGFYGTDLDLQLRRRGIRDIALAGIATNIGIESTARSAHEHGYNIILVEDAMSGLNSDDHRFAVDRIFPLIGRVASTDDVIAALNRHAAKNS